MFHHGQVVGDEQDGHVALFLQTLYQFQNLFLDGDVQRGCGLVAYQELGIAGECHGYHHALLHPPGKLVGILVHAPLRHGKGTVFEGGIRTPAAVRWPKSIAGGRKIEAPIAYIDVLPTIMRIVGVSDNGGKPIDGLDVLDVLRGKKAHLDRDLFSYIGQRGENDEHIALTTEKWKIVCIGPNIIDDRFTFSDRQYSLFRIDRDPLEKENLSEAYPEILESLIQRLRDFRSLQPSDGVPPHNTGKQDFQAPREWKIKNP